MSDYSFFYFNLLSNIYEVRPNALHSDQCATLIVNLDAFTSGPWWRGRIIFVFKMRTKYVSRGHLQRMVFWLWKRASKLIIALLELQIKCYLTVRNNSTGSGRRDFQGTVNGQWKWKKIFLWWIVITMTILLGSAQYYKTVNRGIQKSNLKLINYQNCFEFKNFVREILTLRFTLKKLYTIINFCT